MYSAEEFKLKSLIAQTLGVHEDLVIDELSYQDIPQWDSLKHVNLILAIEKTYGCRIDEEAVLKLATIRKIREFIFNVPRLSNNSKVPAESTEKEIHRGLRNVFYDKSEISLIDGTAGILAYRGYNISDLCQFSTFEECTYLLLYKKLPTSNELFTFKKKLSEKRKLNSAIITFLTSLKTMTSLEMLRTVVSAFPMLYKNTILNSEEEIAIELIAKIPTILTTHHAIRSGKNILESDENLSHAENFLYLLTGKKPTVKEARILDQDLILHADHGSNASTFTARIVTGAEGDIFSAITAAISTFSGRLHGGALEEVMFMLEEIKDPENAYSYVMEKIATGQPIFGYGHSVYRTLDPRAIEMKKIVKELSIDKNNTHWLAILENINLAMEQHTKYGINENVDFYAAVIYELLNIPHDMFISIFIMSRISGWIAQIYEQKSNNILIRPRLNYVGEKTKNYVLLNERDI